MVSKPKVRSCPAAPTNYSIGRRRPISRIVIHTMQGTLKGTCAWFADPKARASAHYSIGFEGELVEHVSEDNTCWHCGNAKYNRESVGIELEGFMEKGFFPDPMLDTLVKTLAYLCDKYQVPRTRAAIIGHNEVPSEDGKGFGGNAHHKDPGPKFPWDEVMRRLQVLV